MAEVLRKVRQLRKSASGGFSRSPADGQHGSPSGGHASSALAATAYDDVRAGPAPTVIRQRQQQQSPPPASLGADEPKKGSRLLGKRRSWTAGSRRSKHLAHSLADDGQASPSSSPDQTPDRAARPGRGSADGNALAGAVAGLAISPSPSTSTPRRSASGQQNRKSIPRKPLSNGVNAPASPATTDAQLSDRVTAPASPAVAAAATTKAQLARELDGVVDLRDSAQTTVAERYAPAVTHAVVTERRHHVREEHITRHIHTHDVFHRVQPIIDVEVLPARHYVPTADGSLAEVPESALPGRVRDGLGNWVVAETVSRLPGTLTAADYKTPAAAATSSTDAPATIDAPATGASAAGPFGQRRFTARAFDGTDGDEKRYTTPDGVQHIETTWVHPPVLEEGGRLTGQTVPVHFGRK